MLTRSELERIKAARAAVSAEIAANRGDGSNRFAAGLANEGYAGGYRQALDDVLLLVESKTTPNTRGYWDAP